MKGRLVLRPEGKIDGYEVFVEVILQYSENLEQILLQNFQI